MSKNNLRGMTGITLDITPIWGIHTDSYLQLINCSLGSRPNWLIFLIYISVQIINNLE